MRDRLVQFSQSTGRTLLVAIMREIEAGKFTTTWRRPVPPSASQRGAAARRPLAVYE